MRHPPTDFDVVVDVAIRMDAVQDMIQESDSLMTSSDRRNSATIGCELGNLMGKGQHRWMVSSEEDVKLVASQIDAACRQTILPFIGRYSDFAYALETLMRDEKTARLISPIDDKRSKTVVALSKLLES